MLLPHPIPHPLHSSPWDLPRWVDEAVTWVMGYSWPDADEKQTWDVADRWYALAADPQLGTTPGALPNTAPDVRTDSAVDIGPVVSLAELSDALGRVIEECGHDIETAKLEAWVELVTFLIELVGMAVAVALTLGAATRAMDALITATRFAIQQTFRRLDNQLARTVATPPILA